MENHEPMKRYLPVFEEIYLKYNKREFVSPDPLQFLYDYQDIRDREIAGLIASSLAYGKVQQILKSVSRILHPLGKNPHEMLLSCGDTFLENEYSGFKHRFTTDREMISLLKGMRQLLFQYGSLETALCDKIQGEGKDALLSGISSFVNELGTAGGLIKSSLLVCPSRNSACKRFFLFLKWMVREDQVDPGGWSSIDPSRLIMPVDTHVYNISKVLDITRRKSVDLKTALEITSAFQSISPEDPTKYDFALTRFGIRPDMDVCELFQICGCNNTI